MNLTDVFTIARLTEAINALPQMPTRLGSLGLFEEKGVPSRTVLIERKVSSYALLEVVPVGAPPQHISRDKRDMRALIIPHIPVEESILPEDVENVRRFGSENEYMSISELVTERLEKIRKTFDITLEWMRVGAIKGAIYDGKGNLVLNLFDEFSITQPTVEFELDSDATEVLTKCHKVKRIIEQNSYGQLIKGYRALCSPEFFDYLVTHPSVKDAFKGWQAAQAMLAEDKRQGFTFGGIVWEEYNATLIDANGDTVRLIDENEAYVFPEGTDFFKTYFAPAAFNDTVNNAPRINNQSLVVPIYSRMQERKYGKGYDIYAECNPLPICTNPNVLVKVTV